MSNTQELIINNITAGYKNKTIINNLSLAPLQTGQVISLVGSNGAGKSTFLRAISGLIRATGEVLFNKTNLLSCSAENRANCFGLMPQDIPTGSSLNVFETVMSALMVNKHNISNQLAYLTAANILTKLNLENMAESTLANLSGGQRQMVSLAQAIVRNPPILLLDEPTSALDMRRQFFVMQKVRSLASEGHLIFVVLHDLALAAKWSERIIVLKAGSLYCEGTPQQTITAQTLADVYKVKAEVAFISNHDVNIKIVDIL